LFGPTVTRPETKTAVPRPLPPGAREPVLHIPVLSDGEDRTLTMTPVKRTRTERLQVVLSADEIAAVDEFRFDTRKPNRAAAVRELLWRGLKNEDQLSEPARLKGRQQ
jgi:hypothetical protein